MSKRGEDMQGKSLKQYCKDAKKRLKNGFWQNYFETREIIIEKAQNNGASPEKVKEYLNGRLSSKIRDQINEEDEKFYEKVKKILLEEGEISNAIGILTNKSEFDSLSYEERQRYTLSLSEKYVKAVERFNQEKTLGIID